MDDAVLMQVGNGPQDLFDHTAGVFFRVNASIQNTVEELSARHPFVQKLVKTSVKRCVCVYISGLIKDVQLHDEVIMCSRFVEVFQCHHIIMLYPERHRET